MKKILKLTLKILAGLIGLILLAAILIPLFFKDDIQQAIDSELEASLNATVFYDVDGFNVSLFRNFPNLSVQLKDFGIKGEGVFEEDTLVSVKNFEVTVDLASLFGEITVNKIQLDDPTILVLVLDDGTANYDITVPSEEEEVTKEGEESEASDLSIKIDRWEINNADLIYYDQSMDFYTSLENLTHTGSGDFSADVFQMLTRTTIESFSLGYEDTEYISEKSVQADVTMNMDLAKMTFAFAENFVALNDFGFGFDGTIAMPANDITMDITFAGNEIDMKSVLSLIPGAYDEYLEGLEASGKINFDGLVKGTYNDTSMPQIKTTLQIKNGKVSTPDLPQPLEKIQVAFGLNYPSADLSETSISLDYSSELAQQKAALKLEVKNLDDYQWAVDFKGELDLEKLAKVLPLDSTELRGNVIASLKTAGQMSDVEAESWDELPTSGQLSVTDFYYQSNDLPQGFGMSQVDAGFDPEKIELRAFSANAGRTDLNLKGILTNYLAFALGKEEKLHGRLDFTSSKVDLNEWMTSEEVVDEEITVDTTVLEVVRIPENIDFTLASSIDELLYDNLTLEDFKGKILVKDGSVILDDAGFNLLNGTFTMDGEYASAPDQPTFAFDFGIKELSIPEAFKAFTPIQKLVPVAEKMTGNFTTNFAANGALGSDMMPDLTTLSAAGLVEIAEAALNNVGVLDGIQKITNLKKGSTSETMAVLKDVALSTQIKDGRLSVKPFNLTIGGNETIVSGSTGLDGSLDYIMAMKVPSGDAGQMVNQALSKFTGGNSLVSEFLDLNISIGGTYAKPAVKLIGAKPDEGEGSLAASVKEQAKEKVDEKVEEVKEQVKEEVTAVVDSVKAEAEKKVEETKEEAKKKLEEQAKDKLKNLFKKKKKSGN